MKGLTAALAMSLSLLLGAGAAMADPGHGRGGDQGDRGGGRWERAEGPRGEGPRAEARGRGWGGPPPWAQGRGPPPGRGRYGPPPRYAPQPYAAARARAYVRPGGHPRWARGQYLPPAYRGYVVEDYRRYHLRPPPYGYYWTRSGSDYLLTAAATGMIFEVIGADPY